MRVMIIFAFLVHVLAAIAYGMDGDWSTVVWIGIATLYAVPRWSEIWEG